jgi:hypothetical protein
MSNPDDTILHQDDVEEVVRDLVDTEYVDVAAVPVTATTAQLADVGHAINTANKHAGTCVFNTTTNKPVWAVGSAAADVWKDAAASTAHSPV